MNPALHTTRPQQEECHQTTKNTTEMTGGYRTADIAHMKKIKQHRPAAFSSERARKKKIPMAPSADRPAADNRSFACV